MSESFHSQIWYRVAPLKPALKPGLEIALHSYLGRPWFVIRDPVGATHHRFSAEAYAVIGAMTGAATLDEIWRAAGDRLGARAPSQDEVLTLVMQLYQADLLRVDIVPLAEELVERMGRKRGQKRARFYKNPLAIPVPLFDPDAGLERLAPLVRGRAIWVWALGWLALVGAAAAVLPATWADLQSQGVREILALQNLALMACVYPVIKALHELAHGLVVKRYGGECREVGVMLLVFFPVPYVDASASSAFPSKGARALTGGAGILAEIAVAAAALFLWRAAEPGLVRDAAFNAMLIAGFSTIVVNGNPLLKFDGYYVLADLIEIPNLQKRANDWWGAMLRRRVLRAPDPQARRATPFEARVFALYAPAAFVYRLVVMVSIALYVAGTYLAVGVALAAWALVQAFLLPLGKTLRHFVTDQRLAEVRGRAGALAGGATAALALAALLVPVPLRTTVPGVVWLPEAAQLRAGTAGTVAEVLAEPGAALAAGAPVLRLENIDLAAERAARAAEVAEARQALRVAQVQDRTAVAIARERLAQAEAELADLDDRRAALILRSGAAGRLELDRPADLVGRYLTKGALIGHVLPERPDTVRAVAPEFLAEQLPRLRQAELRLAQATAQSHDAELARVVPAAARTLPSPALSRAAGGPIPTDPTDPAGTTALDPFLALDLAVAGLSPDTPFGGRAFARLDFGAEPVAFRLYRATRRVFLRHFGQA